MKGREHRGRVVAVTGGARGIGLATAAALHRAGACVALGDIDADAVHSAARSLGPEVPALPLDVTDEEGFDRFLAHVEDDLGPLDVLINNAGIMPIGGFLDQSPALVRRAIDINVVGVLTGMRTALRRMLPRGAGHIVNLSSAAGRSPVPGALPYAASKAAVVSMTESARVEFHGRGISFTCVMPSFTDTELISGTVGTRFVRTVSAGQVGSAIASAIASPRPDVYVPAVLGPMLNVQNAVGRAVRDRMNGLLGADRVFLDYDREARRSYVDRTDP